MRKSGWAVAATLGLLALLLAGCGGGSSSSSAGGSSTTQAAARPSSAIGDLTPGDTVLIVQKSKLGYVLALANGYVVYTYGNDKKGGQPSCTGSCASAWPAVMGVPQTNGAETLPGTLGTITLSNGAKQITYNGYPLYTYKGAVPLSTHAVPGLWNVIKLSASDITGG
jgi:predicted lipoprotein with Yx(FWY)xxD motif